jgi:hypothetical protein
MCFDLLNLEIDKLFNYFPQKKNVNIKGHTIIFPQI